MGENYYCENEDMDAIDAALERHMQRICKSWEDSKSTDWGAVIEKLEKKSNPAKQNINNMSWENFVKNYPVTFSEYIKANPNIITKDANSDMHKLPNYIYGHLLS